MAHDSPRGKGDGEGAFEPADHVCPPGRLVDDTPTRFASPAAASVRVRWRRYAGPPNQPSPRIAAAHPVEIHPKTAPPTHTPTRRIAPTIATESATRPHMAIRLVSVTTSSFTPNWKRNRCRATGAMSRTAAKPDAIIVAR